MSDGEQEPIVEGDANQDLLERIRQLEEKNKHLEEQNRHVEEKNRRLEKENDIFRKILRACRVDADDALVRYLDGDADDVLDGLKDLNRRINMNSGNSSIPSSKDKPWHRPKKRSLRIETGRKAGGQAGHPGSTMAIPHEADRVVMLYPPGCESCPKRAECESLGAFSCAEKRSVVDIEVSTTVTEYRALRRGPCPSASAKGDTGVFPEGVRAFVQYGDGIAVFAGILDAYGAMSDKRIAEVINGMSGLNMSPSTVIAMTERCAEAVAPAMGPIADAVAASPIVNCDETGTRAVIEVERESDGCDDASGDSTGSVCRNVWIHGASNQEFTCLRMSTIRGYEGIVEAGVIPRVRGTIIHDSWSSYWKFEWLRHGLCNAHILRELRSVTENEPEHGWAQMFADLLIRMKKAKEDAEASGAASLPRDVLDGFHREYAEILDAADRECPPKTCAVKKRGRKKKGKERSLIERLRLREREICLFVDDFDVSFDNNLAERAFRFVKTKTKVSGCFRSLRCLQQYLDIMSYIDTARKHGVSAFNALSMAFQGRCIEAVGLS